MNTKTAVLCLVLVLLGGRYLTGCTQYNIDTPTLSNSAQMQGTLSSTLTKTGMITEVYGNEISIQLVDKTNTSNHEDTMPPFAGSKQPSEELTIPQGNKSEQSQGTTNNSAGKGANSAQTGNKPSENRNGNFGGGTGMGSTNAYTLSDKTEKYTIPIGTPVNRMGSTMTFSVLSKEQYITLHFNEADTIISIDIMG